uniref:YczE/YyaS/YitT family protein n=1 Tax=Phascolarctobacterium faecium TaxID=33025 RepID=UPI003AB261A6
MNWKDKHNLFFKLLRLHFGLALYSIGLTLGIQANIGLAPWEAFGIGVSYVTGLTYGTINVLSGLLILVVTVAMGERFGLGTILNAVLIGFGVDVLQYYHAVPLIENYWLGIIVMFLGQFSISLGTYFYISAGLGSGPRDSLMIGLKRRLPKVPIGMIRGLIEGSVLLAVLGGYDKVTAADISKAALKVAKKNVRRHFLVQKGTARSESTLISD